MTTDPQHDENTPSGADEEQDGPTGQVGEADANPGPPERDAVTADDVHDTANTPPEWTGDPL